MRGERRQWHRQTVHAFDIVEASSRTKPRTVSIPAAKGVPQVYANSSSDMPYFSGPVSMIVRAKQGGEAFLATFSLTSL